MQDLDKDIIKTKYLRTLPNINQERTQKFFGIVLTLLALILFGFFAINPTISAILKLKKEVADSEFVNIQLGNKIKNLSSLRNQYTDIESDLPIITNAIPTEPEIHFLFAQIQTIASQANVKIKNLQNFETEVIRANSKPSEKKYYSYSFSITGEGLFKDVSTFISNISDMQRVVDISLLTITNQNRQALGFNIQGTAFFKK